jgi:hypothetical protein
MCEGGILDRKRPVHMVVHKNHLTTFNLYSSRGDITNRITGMILGSGISHTGAHFFCSMNTGATRGIQTQTPYAIETYHVEPCTRTRTKHVPTNITPLTAIPTMHARTLACTHRPSKLLFNFSHTHACTTTGARHSSKLDFFIRNATLPPYV